MNYKDDTIAVIQKIKDLTSGGIQNYSNMVNHWLQNTDYQIDSEEKRAVLINMFTKSRVSVIYGSAGTGKTTLINHISHLLPAVMNIEKSFL